MTGPSQRESDPERGLLDVLERARAAGHLGPGPVHEHLDHARALTRAIPADASTFVDLGSGGGVPGLVVAVERPDLQGELLEGSTRRGAHLTEAVQDLGLADRLSVMVARAEEAGRDPQRRARFDVVVARSFGPPAVVAECAAPLLRVGGRLIVSDPPSGSRSPDGRWPADGLAPIGLTVIDQVVGPPAYTILEQSAPCPDRFPRRVGIPAKRPLF